MKKTMPAWNKEGGVKGQGELRVNSGSRAKGGSEAKREIRPRGS